MFFFSSPQEPDCIQISSQARRLLHGLYRQFGYERNCMDVVAGIDIGGSTLKVALVDMDGDSIFEDLVQAPSLVQSGPAATMKAAEHLLKETVEKFVSSSAHILRIGLCTPGPATKDGVISRPGNLKHPEWANFPIRQACEDFFRRQVDYLNDGTAAVLAEARRRPKASSVSGFAVGTGLGAGHVDKGRPIIGHRGAAAESGHILLPVSALRCPGFPVEFRCGCQRSSCIEAYVSLQGLKALVKGALLQRENAFHPLTEIEDCSARVRQVLALADGGDELCRNLILWQAHALGVGISQVVHDIDPEVFVISGGVTEVSPKFWDLYLAEVQAGYDASCMEIFRDLKIEKAIEGDRAGAIGAAIFALQNLDQQSELLA